jgi:hypothetical protein
MGGEYILCAVSPIREAARIPEHAGAHRVPAYGRQSGPFNSCCAKRADGTQVAGGMFWLTRKKFFGSYFALMAASLP